MSRLTKGSAVLCFLAVATLAAPLIVPNSVEAQDGPQFPTWGPGMSPPDQEGPDQTTPSTTGAPSPYGYYSPPLGVAPVPVAGCPYDLRGTWRNDGRQTTGGYYSASVYVRQYRSWIQASQDDGTSYYGQCLGTRLQFDMYYGYQYLGRQYGTITGGYGPTPVGYAVAPSPGAWNIRADFTWTTWFGSGTETWSRSSYGLPWVIDPWTGGWSVPVPTPLPSVVPAPTSMPTVLPTPTPVPTLVATPTSTLAPGAIRIDWLFPSRGPAATEVVVSGSGFTADDNLVTFGASTSLYRPDGTPANLAARVASVDGRTLRFTIPWSSPSGTLCDSAANCVGITATLLQPGSYDVTVTNANGSSNAVSFEMTANSGTPSR